MSDGDDDILRALESPDEENRRRALFLVAQQKDVRALPALRRMAAEDPSIEVRYYARKALLFFQQAGRRDTGGSGGGGPDLRAALEALQSPEARTRNEAVQALARSGGDEALRALLGLADRETDPFVRATLAVAVGICGGPAQLGALDLFLKDPDPRVRANAIEGLMHIGGGEVPRRVVPYLKDNDNRVKVNAYTALGKFKKLDLLKSLGDMLIAEKLWVRDAAAYALVKMEMPESVALLEHALGDGYVGVRLKARNGLVRLATRGVAQALLALERAGGDRGPPSSYLTTDMLVHRPRTGSGPLDDQAGRLALIRRIVEAHDQEKLGMLVRQLSREKSPKVLATLLIAVGKLGDTRALGSLYPFLDSPDRRIRANAVEAVGLLADEEELMALEPYLLDADNRVRANAIVALGSGGLDCERALQDMVRSPDELMRLSSIYALVELGRLEQVSYLEELLEDSAAQVRKKAIDALRILAADGLAPAGQLLRQAGLPEAPASL